MNILGFILGRSWPQRIIVLVAVGLYIYLGFTRAELAKKGITSSFRTSGGLLTLIFAALMISKAIDLLLPADTIMDWFGEEAGIKGVVTGGLLGGLLQGGPYAVYPIIKSLYDKGAHISVVIAMLMGYGAIGLARVPYGLVFLGPEIVGLRLLIAVPLTIISGIIIFLIF